MIVSRSEIVPLHSGNTLEVRRSCSHNRKTEMRFIQIALVTVGAVLQTACPMVDFKEFKFTHSKPVEKDVIGTWTPTASTLRELKERGHYPPAKHALILRGDHTFSMMNMPDWWQDGFGHSHGKFESAEGTWTLEPEKDLWQICVIRLQSAKTLDSSVNLYRQKSPYLIFIRVGDPNNGDAMFFEREH